MLLYPVSSLKIITVPVLTFLIVLCSGCRTTQPIGEKIKSFPKDYTGLWEGQLEIFQKKDIVAQSILMSLEMKYLTDSTYTWQLIYGKDDSDVRPYTLKVIDSEVGKYMIDEHNGIQLELQHMGDQLCSWFDVMGNLLNITYTLSENAITFRVQTIRINQFHTSGDSIIQQDTIPEVKSYPVLVNQKAILRRRNP